MWDVQRHPRLERTYENHGRKRKNALMIADLTPYRKYVDQFDLTEEQKLEWVNAMLMIVESIFDKHLGSDPLSHSNPE